MPFRGQSFPHTELLIPLLDLCEEAAVAIRGEYPGNRSTNTSPKTLAKTPGNAGNNEGAALGEGAPRNGQDRASSSGDARNRGAPGGLLREKADSSPLTAADLASHAVLARGLAALTPDTPLLSEESPAAEVEDRRAWRRFWLVDPLDGTREFLERSGEFTINIALVEAARPRLGIVYEPLRQRACAGLVGEGAWRFWLRDGRWQRQALTTRPMPAHELIVLSSRRHRNERLAASLAFLEARFNIDRRNSGSALKFCDLAAGAGDVYPRFSACSEWDVAAGDALVTAAGGAVWGLDGEPLRYNERDSLLSPHFIAVGDPTATIWPALLDALPG